MPSVGPPPFGPSSIVGSNLVLRFYRSGTTPVQRPHSMTHRSPHARGGSPHPQNENHCREFVSLLGMSAAFPNARNNADIRTGSIPSSPADFFSPFNSFS